MAQQMDVEFLFVGYNTKLKWIFYVPILVILITNIIVVNSTLQNNQQYTRDRCTSYYENLYFSRNETKNYTQEMLNNSFWICDVFQERHQYDDEMDINYKNMVIDTIKHFFFKSKNNKQMLVFIVSVEKLSVIRTLDNILANYVGKEIIYLVDTFQDESVIMDELGFIFSKSHKVFERTKNTDIVFVTIGSVKLYEVVLQQARLQDRALNVQGYFTFLYKFVLFFEHMEHLQEIELSVSDVNHVTAFVKENADSFTTNRKYLQRISPGNVTIVPDAVIYSAMWKQFLHRKFELIGSLYDDYNSPDFMYSTMFPNTGFGFNGQQLLIGSQIWAEYLEEHIDSAGHVTYNGSYYEIMHTMSQALNFTFEIVIPENEAWGSEVSPGIWNGMVGLLQNRTIDIVIAPLTVSVQRLQVMDFSNVALEYSYVVPIYRKPNPITNTLYIYAKPFKHVVWVCLLLVFCVFSVIIWLANKVDACTLTSEVPRYHIMYDFNIKLKEIGPLFNLAANVFASFLKEVINVNDKSGSLRFLWGSWWIFSLIIASMWSAAIISFIAMPLYPTLFTTLDELASQKFYTIGLTAYTSTETLVRESHPHIWSRIVDFSKDDPTVLSSVYSLQEWKVSNENYVLIEEYSGAKQMMRQNCRITTANDIYLSVAQYAMGMQKNSAYKDIIDKFSMQLKEFGLVDFWLRMYESKDADNSCSKDENSPIVLRYSHFQWWMYLLLMLLSLACVVFLAEKWLHTYKM